MKKLFLTLFAVASSLAALATDYTGTLTVTVNGEATVQNGVAISIVQNDNNTYDLTLENFILSSDDNIIPVGNINLTEIEGAKNGNITALYVDKSVLINEGNDPGVGGWFGPMLGLVPLKMIARFTDDYLAVDIDIDMQESLQQVINVKFDNTDKHFQLPNGDFEEWSSNSDISEPRNWHGFKSATGSLAGSATSTLLKSTDIRDGATGNYSAVIASTSIFGVIANGTVTNGQLMAQSMTATNTWNHSQMEETSSATDKYGDKFYMPVFAKPDAIKTWIKFVPGGTNTDYPYSTLSAIIFNGEYYQDPEPKVGDKSAPVGGTAYTQDDADEVASRVVAKAQNKEIGADGWKELVVPFDYTTYLSNNADAKAILVTVSTNATPGKGNKNDQVFLDDMELLYYANITDIKYKGRTVNGFNSAVTTYDMGEIIAMPSVSDFSATVEGISATTLYQVLETETGYQVIVYAISGDLQTANAYVFNFTSPQEVVLDGVSFTESRNWATWYGDQPFQRPENVLVYTVTYNGGNTVTIPARTLSYIPAGVGVLLYSTTPANEVTALPYDGTAGSPTSALQGFLVDTPISNGYVLYNGTFILSESGTLAAHRCYLPIVDADNAPRMLMIADEGSVTGIDTIETVDHGAARYFDINGREVNANAKGVIIVRYSDGTVTKMIKH